MFFYISRGQGKRGATWRGRVGCWAGRCSCTRAPPAAASRGARVITTRHGYPTKYTAKSEFDTPLFKQIFLNFELWYLAFYFRHVIFFFLKVANIFVKFSNWRVSGWCVRARGVIWKARARKRDGQFLPRRTPPPPCSRMAPIRSSDEMWMGPVSHEVQFIYFFLNVLYFFANF